MQVELMRVEEAAKCLGIGRSKIYELIAQRRIPVVRIDRSVRISRSALQDWIAEHSQATTPPV